MSTGLDLKEKKIVNKQDVVFPAKVRELLNINNDEIKHLCKQVSVFPKKDTNSGKTFFLKDDVEVLRMVKELHDRGRKIATGKKVKKSQKPAVDMQGVDVPLKSFEKPLKVPATIPADLVLKKDQEVETAEIKELMDCLVKSQETMMDRISSVIDEKLDGMDEVVVELIRCKTENESLRQKINELTKENYRLKKEHGSYKSLGLGLYIKNDNSGII